MQKSRNILAIEIIKSLLRFQFGWSKEQYKKICQGKTLRDTLFLRRDCDESHSLSEEPIDGL